MFFVCVLCLFYFGITAFNPGLSSVERIGFLGSFLANNLKTTQLEVNTDLSTSRAIARLKEPRNLFALPKDKDNECPQQTARWPAECQVR